MSSKSPFELDDEWSTSDEKSIPPATELADTSRSLQQRPLSTESEVQSIVEEKYVPEVRLVIGIDYGTTYTGLFRVLQ
jgi:hypothetical protein